MSIRVNVSEQENRAGAREPLPIGKYHVAITDVELTESNSDEHPGEPMLKFEFTVQDSPGSWQEFANRKDYTNACLWEGALYTIIMILKALGKYEDCKDANGELDIPTEPEFYLGEEIMIRRGVDPKQKRKWPDMEERWVQIRGILPYDEESAHKDSAKHSSAGHSKKEHASSSSMMP